MVLIDDKLSLLDAGILDQRDKLEVEIVIKLSVDVQGKGKDYSAQLEVSPDAVILSSLQSKLAFFKTLFFQRRMQLFIIAKDATTTLVDDLNKTFREVGLKEDGVL